MTSAFSNVTISLLPVSLSLVHIPRSRLSQLSHPVLRQILQPNPIFINVTCNEIELSLFAESHMLADFEPIARRDRQRQRSRSGSGSGTKRARTALPQDHLEISYEKWNVLQIDSHSDQLDNSGARVHELSAPLAAAGISILYQSSYLSDFIFVKESRLQEVMSLLGSTGFDLYSSDPELLTSRVVSPILSPISPDDSFVVVDTTQDITAESGAILTRTRNGLDTVSVAAITLQHIMSPDNSPNSSPTDHKPPSRHKSHSPTSGEVRMLPPKLACVGLSDDNVDTWGLKIVKLVAFPELIPVKEQHHSRSSKSLSADHANSSPNTIAVPLSLSGREQHSSDSFSSSGDEDEEGYFSHSPRGSLSSTSLLSSVASRSFPDLSQSTPAQSTSFKPSARHLVAALAPLSPLESKPPPHRRSTFHHRNSSATIKKPADEGMRATVPFFSFTRTHEGTSLTTDVSLLAALFPPSERHMMICAGELDALEAQSSNVDSDSEEGEDALSSDGTLKCLQIDLRRFGLDKHGLVNRFSRVLEENGINHMYSSTFKTANLLVSKTHANRARALLKSC